MKFTKMHGIGNDYIYINCLEEKIDNPSDLAIQLSDRHFGIGSDGLVLILESDIADFKMRMFNKDGSESEMCGNAIRCVGKFIYDNALSKELYIKIDTLAGIKTLELFVEDNDVKLIKVDMGEPILTPKEVPCDFKNYIVVNELLEVVNDTYNVTCVSMGNPHAIIFVEDVNCFPLEQVGPIIESHVKFPRKTNVEFVQLIDDETLKMRVWERGAGETLACGTGACAVLVSSVLNKVSKRKATIKLLGGDLIIEWDEKSNRIFMTGSATTVFTGEIQIN